MKIGMFTMGYMRYPLERAFQDAERLGYDGIGAEDHTPTLRI